MHPHVAQHPQPGPVAAGSGQGAVAGEEGFDPAARARGEARRGRCRRLRSGPWSCAGRDRRRRRRSRRSGPAGLIRGEGPRGAPRVRSAAAKDDRRGRSAGSRGSAARQRLPPKPAVIAVGIFSGLASTMRTPLARRSAVGGIARRVVAGRPELVGRRAGRRRSPSGRPGAPAGDRGRQRLEGLARARGPDARSTPRLGSGPESGSADGGLDPLRFGGILGRRRRRPAAGFRRSRTAARGAATVLAEVAGGVAGVEGDAVWTPSPLTTAPRPGPGSTVGTPPSTAIAVKGPLGPLAAIPRARRSRCAVTRTGPLAQPRGAPRKGDLGAGRVDADDRAARPPATASPSRRPRPRGRSGPPRAGCRARSCRRRCRRAGRSRPRLQRSAPAQGGPPPRGRPRPRSRGCRRAAAGPAGGSICTTAGAFAGDPSRRRQGLRRAGPGVVEAQRRRSPAARAGRRRPRARPRPCRCRDRGGTVEMCRSGSCPRAGASALVPERVPAGVADAVVDRRDREALSPAAGDPSRARKSLSACQRLRRRRRAGRSDRSWPAALSAAATAAREQSRERRRPPARARLPDAPHGPNSPAGLPLPRCRRLPLGAGSGPAAGGGGGVYSTAPLVASGTRRSRPAPASARARSRAGSERGLAVPAPAPVSYSTPLSSAPRPAGDPGSSCALEHRRPRLLRAEPSGAGTTPVATQAAAPPAVPTQIADAPWPAPPSRRRGCRRTRRPARAPSRAATAAAEARRPARRRRRGRARAASG